MALKCIAGRASRAYHLPGMNKATSSGAAAVLTPREVQTVAKARRIIERWDLGGRPIDDALAHLRAMYALRRRGLADYIQDTMGPLASLPLRRFRLFADTRGEHPVATPADNGQTLVDYLVETCDQRTLPGLIQLTQGREGDEREFYL